MNRADLERYIAEIYCTQGKSLDALIMSSGRSIRTAFSGMLFPAISLPTADYRSKRFPSFITIPYYLRHIIILRQISCSLNKNKKFPHRGVKTKEITLDLLPTHCNRRELFHLGGGLTPFLYLHNSAGFPVFDWDMTLYTCTVGGQSRVTVRFVREEP